MSSAQFLLVLALCFIAVNIVCSMLVVGELMKRNIKINFFLLRLLIPKYVHQYKQMTLEETGRVGVLFPLWIVSINASLLLIVIYILLRIV